MGTAGDYRERVHEVYAAAAVEADPGLCCAEGGSWTLPGLEVPPRMLEMNYGCGSTVHPADLSGEGPVLYVGVGGGLEALRFAYFRRRAGGVIAVDPVEEMREAARRNLEEAARRNPWFRPEYVRILDGAADALPVEAESAGVVAQNCLFNVFTAGDLDRAIREVCRVLVRGGLFSTSDPVTTEPLPEALAKDATLRARCISGCIPYEAYLAALQAGGFPRLVVRGRRPYRLLLPTEFPALERPILLESLEVLARKAGGNGSRPEVFTGRTATYRGPERSGRAEGFAFPAGRPCAVSDRVATALEGRSDYLVTASTFHASGEGCC